LSSAGTKDSDLIGDSLDIISWFVGLATSCGATSWSMEQVPTRPVIKLLQSFRRKHPLLLSFEVFDFHELGLPQRRKRVIAGSPGLISRLLRLRGCGGKSSIQDVIPHPLGTHIRNTLFSSGRRKRQANDPDKRNGKFVYKKAGLEQSCYPITGPSPTILAGRNSGHWINFVDGKPQKTQLRLSDISALQTFPSGYLFHEKNAVARRLIGNAIPPAVSALLLQKGVRKGKRVLCCSWSPSYSSEKHMRL
jgi:site-specific DNA-cytosine methylase